MAKRARGSDRRRLTEPRALRSAAAILGAILIHLSAQASMVLLRTDFSWSAFRGYYASDQLSYMGIVVNAAHGDFRALEPFTQTGTIHYPRDYYLLLGEFARIFGIDPTTAWLVCGLLVQVVLVGALASTCILLSGRSWTGLLAAGPFVLGTYSTLAAGAWFTTLDSHAVLWGPYGVLFPLNAEAAGLCAAGCALLAVLVAYVRRSRRAASIVLLVVASLLIGFLANVQTYSFLTAVYMFSFVVSAIMLTHYKRLWWGCASLLLLVALFVVGPSLHDRLGPLAVLMLGLLPAVPGLIVGAIRTRGLVAGLFGLIALAASPSVIGTLQGVRDDDPFLAYRVVSSSGLGVPWRDGLVAGAVLLLPLGLVFFAGLHRRNAMWSGYAVGASVAWVVIATNDRWGANQEPYRLWIDGFFLVAVTLLPVLILVAREYLEKPGRAQPPAAEGAEEAPAVSVRSRQLVRLTLAAILVAALVSAVDWAAFYHAQRNIELLQFDRPREIAMAASVGSGIDGLVIADPCIDPTVLKIATGAPVVYMNIGMAWPSDYGDVEAILAARDAGELDVEAARSAGATWVVTDSSCSPSWASTYASVLAKQAATAYRDGGSVGTITLWRLSTSKS